MKNNIKDVIHLREFCNKNHQYRSEKILFMAFLLGCQISTFQIEDSVTILQSGFTPDESHNTILSERENYINISLNFPLPVFNLMVLTNVMIPFTSNKPILLIRPLLVKILHRSLLVKC